MREEVLSHELDLLVSSLRAFIRRRYCDSRLNWESRQYQFKSSHCHSHLLWFFSFSPWGIALAEVPFLPLRGLSRRTLMFLVLSGLATGFLSWVCYFRATQLGRGLARGPPVDKTQRRFRHCFRIYIFWASG